MKITIVFIFIVCTFFLTGCATSHPANKYKTTYSSFDQPSDHPPGISPPMTSGAINFQGVRLDQVLEIYSSLSHRTIIRGPLPSVQINLRTATPVTCIQTLQMLDTVLAENGIVMVLSGNYAVKAVTVSEANSANPPEITLPWEQLPESSSFMMRTVQVKYVKPSMVVPCLAPFSKMPASILAIDGENLIVLRDYSANIRQMLQMLEKVDHK